MLGLGYVKVNCMCSWLWSHSCIYSANVLRSIRDHRWKLADFNTSRWICQVQDYGFGHPKTLATECHGWYEQKFSSDVYSCAVTVLEAASNVNFGRKPPSDERINGILNDLNKTDDFDQLILDMTSKNARDRPRISELLSNPFLLRAVNNDASRPPLLEGLPSHLQGRLSVARNSNGSGWKIIIKKGNKIFNFTTNRQGLNGVIFFDCTRCNSCKGQMRQIGDMLIFVKGFSFSHHTCS